MFDRLTKSSGFPWAIRAIGFVALVAALLSIPALLSGSSMLSSKRRRRALFDKTALKDPLFLIFTCCSFSTFLGYSTYHHGKSYSYTFANTASLR